MTLSEELITITVQVLMWDFGSRPAFGTFFAFEILVTVPPGDQKCRISGSDLSLRSRLSFGTRREKTNNWLI